MTCRVTKQVSRGVAWKPRSAWLQSPALSTTPWPPFRLLHSLSSSPSLTQHPPGPGAVRHWVGSRGGRLFHSRTLEWISGHWTQPPSCGQGHLQGPRHPATSTTASLKQMCSLLRGDVEAGSSGFVVCSETILLLPPVMELSQEPDYIPLLLKTVLSLWDNPTSLPCAFCPCQLTSLQRHFSSLPSDWTKLFVVPQTHSTLRHL